MRTNEGDCEAVDGEPGVGRLADRHIGLERQVQHLLGAEGVLEDVIRLGHRGRDVAAPQMEVERHVGVALSHEMLEVRKGAGGLELVVHDRLRGHRLDLVEHGWKLLILRLDQLRGRVRHMRIARQHHRDRVADIMHLAGGEDRLIVKRRPIERAGHDLENIIDSHDAMDALERLRGADVELDDAAVRDRAAHDLAIEHAGKALIVHVFGGAGDLGLAFEARDRASDLCERRHQLAPSGLSAVASARAT
jgi:hypothetical protein